MAYSFDDAGAAERRETQYFEMFVQPRHLPQGLDRGDPPQHAVGHGAELPAYRRRRLGALRTRRLDPGPRPRRRAAREARELQRLFLIEAAKYNVLPLDDRRVERFNSDLAGRPQLIRGNSQLLFGGMGRLSENSVVVIKNKSHAVTAEIDVPDGRRRGRDRRPGRRLRRLEPVREGRQARLLLQPLRPPAVQGRRATRRSPPASTRCGWSSPTTAAGSARAARSTLYLDGDKVGEGRVDATVPMVFSADETTDVGSDSATPVSDDYGPQGQPSSPAGCAGSRSTSTRPPRTSTT